MTRKRRNRKEAELVKMQLADIIQDVFDKNGQVITHEVLAKRHVMRNGSTTAAEDVQLYGGMADAHLRQHEQNAIVPITKSIDEYTGDPDDEKAITNAVAGLGAGGSRIASNITLSASPSPSGRRENARDSGGEGVPLVLLLPEPRPTESREAVELRPPVVLGRAPLRADPPAVLETVERRVQRTLVDLEDVRRALLDAHGDAPTVHGLVDLEDLEDEQVQRALEQIPIRVRHLASFGRTPAGAGMLS
jgi:hypothetical protein